MKPTILSLFCGLGGFDLGFKMAGFNTVWACDNNRDATISFKSNFKNTEVVNANIKEINEFPKNIDGIIGGYPCQGFSLGGKRDLEDPRNALYKEYLRVLKIVKPKFFVAENVYGLETMSNGEILNQMLEDFTLAGYNVEWTKVNAKFYGVPQDRKRIFIIGFRNDLNIDFSFPEPTHGVSNIPFVSLKDILNYYNTEVPTEEYCQEDFTSRYMSRNRKKKWNETSFCIVASQKQIPLHPSGESMKKLKKDVWSFSGKINRRLSYKECALIQTFPPNFYIHGNLNSKYKQIGNAVPPLLAYNIAKKIKLFF